VTKSPTVVLTYTANTCVIDCAFIFIFAFLRKTVPLPTGTFTYHLILLCQVLEGHLVDLLHI